MPALFFYQTHQQTARQPLQFQNSMDQESPTYRHQNQQKPYHEELASPEYVHPVIPYPHNQINHLECVLTKYFPY